jgi:acetolactate synthase regulatory subunit
MCFDVKVRMSTVTGGLQRVLSAVERRGFSVVGVHAEPDGQGATLVRIRVDLGERPVASLLRQLEGLFDVTTVEADGPAWRGESLPV